MGHRAGDELVCGNHNCLTHGGGKGSIQKHLQSACHGVLGGVVLNTKAGRRMRQAVVLCGIVNRNGSTWPALLKREKTVRSVAFKFEEELHLMVHRSRNIWRITRHQP